MKGALLKSFFLAVADRISDKSCFGGRGGFLLSGGTSMESSSEKRCKYGPMIDLRAMEEETLAEAREWAKRRMEDKLREKTAVFSPGGEKKDSRRPVPGSGD